MDPEAALQLAIEEQPGDKTAWLALADWLEESGKPDRAELLRLQVLLRQDVGSPGRRTWEGRLQALLLAGTYPWAARRTVHLGRAAELTMVLVPAGRFRMGSAETELGHDDAEGPVHAVALTRAFWMSAYPITRGQWKAVMGGDPGSQASDARPADGVSWLEAQELCRRLTKRTNRLFRLPSEAEWEYACRAGTTTPYFTGEGPDAMKRAGWCNYDGLANINGGSRCTHPVSSYLPNAFGLYDTHGNVMEWCADWFGPYATQEAIDPTGPSSGTGRVVRGGSWYHFPHGCRSAFRHYYAPHSTYNFQGCRVVMTEPGQ